MRIEFVGFWPHHWKFEHRVEHGLAEIITNQHTILRKLDQLLAPKVVARFIITQGDSPMPQGPLTGLAPGATGNFTATPVDTAGNPTTLAAGVVPVWASDDPTDVITPSADGLSASVAVATTATPGATHTLSVSQPDGSANSPVALPVLTPAVQPVASFVITQS